MTTLLQDANTEAQAIDPNTAQSTPVAVAEGDGIGPEIMRATLAILDAADAPLDLRPITIGEQVYKAGNTSGIPDEAWDTIRETGVLLKAPITTPQGGGYKSLNVSIRKTLGLFANVRPCVAYHPFTATNFPGMDVVVVRENEEDTYGGIEHQQTPEVTQCLKLITWPGSLRLCEYAFAYAKAHGRKKVTCFVKDNIMKQTDGMFRKAFEQVAANYPDIEPNVMIIDIGAARLAASPKQFDVVVAPNLYGDIVSDIAAEVAGSVGLVGTANIGPTTAMFEAIHGSAPDIAGRDIANPSGLLLAAVQMLQHLGHGEVAQTIHNAWLCAIEDGMHTADVFQDGVSADKLGTQAFAKAVIDRLGKTPSRLAPAKAQTQRVTAPSVEPPKPMAKEMIGTDVFLHWDRSDRDPDVLANYLTTFVTPHFKLKMITNRGTKVWPHGAPETFCTDHWRCRFVPTEQNMPMTQAKLIALLTLLEEAKIDVIKTENLYTFDGKTAYSLGQGE
ncbi:MAG: NADP-dependent isocitrate dehydrogenase [Phycisphaeraceae bacterium]